MRIRITRREKSGLDPSEHTEAVRFFRLVRQHEKTYPALRWLYAIPNGGKRHKTVAQKMVNEGLRAGVHDYCLPEPVGIYHGLYLELKTRTGDASDEQIEFGEAMTARGYKVEWCRGHEAAWAAVCEYLGIRNCLK